METCTLSRPGNGLNGAAVLLKDSVCHGKSETRAFFGGLGGEERVVNAAQMFGCDAVSGVGNLDDRTLLAAGQNAGARGHFEDPARFHGVARVQEQIEKY